jgi:hypothetical protein
MLETRSPVGERVFSCVAAARSGAPGALCGGDLQAWAKENEIGEEGTHPRRPERFERRRKHLPGTAANGDALSDAGDPALADASQPNGKPAQRELDQRLLSTHALQNDLPV